MVASRYRVTVGKRMRKNPGSMYEKTQFVR